MGVYKRKNSRNYWIQYFVNGKRKREPAGPNYKKALALLGKRKGEIAERKYLDVKEPKIRLLFSEVADKYL